MTKQSLQKAFVEINRQKPQGNKGYMQSRREFTRSRINKRKSQYPILPPVTTIY